jgi:pimeloyl-ACP methyl ester carboxylesterase
MARTIVELINIDRAQPDAVLVDDINIGFWSWGYYPIIDWSGDLAGWDSCYRATPAAGEELARQLEQFIEAGSIDADPSRIHLIGYSYGGYVSAVCGQRFANSGRGRIGQLTGLDVPDVVIPPPIVEVDPAAFGAVTWYVLTGTADLPIKSLTLGGENVIKEEVLADGFVLNHANFPSWYTEHKIVRRHWDSWVAVKDSPRGPLSFDTWERRLDVSYSLTCQGLLHPPPPVVLDEVRSENGQWTITDSDDRETSVQSGVVGTDPLELTLRGGAFASLRYSEGTLMARAEAYEPGYAHAALAAQFAGSTTTAWQRQGPSARNEQATPVLLYHADTVEVHVGCERGETVLPLTEYRLNPSSPFFSFVTVGPETETVRLSYRAAADESSHFGRSGPYVGGYVEFTVDLNMSPFHPCVCDTLYAGLAYDDICPYRESGLAIYPAGAELYTGAPINWYAGHIRSGAEVVWGSSLAFSLEQSSHPQDGIFTIESERQRFRPTVPGLYVIRLTWTSNDDGTSASSNAIVFASGSRE